MDHANTTITTGCAVAQINPFSTVSCDHADFHLKGVRLIVAGENFNLNVLATILIHNARVMRAAAVKVVGAPTVTLADVKNPAVGPGVRVAVELGHHSAFG